MAAIDPTTRRSTDLGHGFPRFLDTAAAFEKPLLAAVNGLGVGIGHDGAAALRPRAHRRHRASCARRSCRSASSPKRPAVCSCRRSWATDARRSRSTPATGSSPRTRSRPTSRCRVVPPTSSSSETMDHRPQHRGAAPRCARREQAGRARRPHRRGPGRARTRRCRVRPHDRRRRERRRARRVPRRRKDPVAPSGCVHARTPQPGRTDPGRRRRRARRAP